MCIYVPCRLAPLALLVPNIFIFTCRQYITLAARAILTMCDVWCCLGYEYMSLTVYTVLWQLITYCIAYFQSELEHRCLKCDIDNHGNPLRVGMYTGEKA